MLPEGVEAVLERRRWGVDPVFDWLQRTANIDAAQMYRTFNCGLGMVVIVPAAHAAAAAELLTKHGESAHIVGEVRSGDRGVVIQE